MLIFLIMRGIAQHTNTFDKEKNMKKLLIMTLALGLALALVACGGTDGTGGTPPLSKHEAGSISIELPSDMQPTEVASGYAFKSEDAAAVSISNLEDVDGSAADITEDTFYGNAENNGMTNVTVSDFTNDMALGSGTSAMATLSGDTSGGKAVTIIMIYYFPTEGQMSVITLLPGEGTSLEQNMQAVIDSIV